MNYRYFVSYQHAHGYGNMEIDLTKQILNIQDVKMIEHHISTEMLKNDGEKLEEVRLMNFQLFF